MQELTEQLEWAVLPYSSKKIKDKFLIATRFGQWALLEQDEFASLNRMDINPGLFDKLVSSNIIIIKDNANKIIQDFRNMNSNLFYGTSLHIISLTSKCNFGCVYCHASSPIYKAKNIEVNMDKKGALRFLTMVFDSNSPALNVEFQGGEPLMNWEMLSFITKSLNEMNVIEKRDIKISLVSNLSLFNDERLEFLLENGVNICTSLDGPKKIHDLNRPFFFKDVGTYETVVKWIPRIREKIKKMGKKTNIEALTTVTKFSLGYPKEIIDEYVRLGFTSIHLRFMNYLGVAKEKWDDIGYHAEEFVDFWRKALDHVIDLNKKGINIKERMAVLLLTKILKKEDPRYTELMSPCGAGRAQILYNEDGSIYTCDEGRMLGNDLFKIGDIYNNSFNEVMGNEKLIAIAKASLIDFYEPNSAYLQWIGTCPVANVSEQGNLIVKTSMSKMHKIYTAQIDYLFEKMIEDKESIEIFKKWVNLKEADGKKVS